MLDLDFPPIILGPAVILTLILVGAVSGYNAMFGLTTEDFKEAQINKTPIICKGFITKEVIFNGNFKIIKTTSNDIKIVHEHKRRILGVKSHSYNIEECDIEGGLTENKEL